MCATGRDTLSLWAPAQAAEMLPGAFGSLELIAPVAYMVLIPGLAGRKLQSVILVAVALPSSPSTKLIIAQEDGQIFLVATGKIQEQSTRSLDHPRRSRSL